MNYNEKPATLTENQRGTLGAMAKCHEANIGQFPKTMQELVDHFDAQQRLLNATETVIETYGPPSRHKKRLVIK